jgi:hypothetical protein
VGLPHGCGTAGVVWKSLVYILDNFNNHEYDVVDGAKVIGERIAPVALEVGNEASKIRMGYYTAFNACGRVAIYNALNLLGLAEHPADIVL